ncbi:MliC family protein [Marinospirillum perlucidum]|uniref:MliC family protein n=1 Tax=Marinospirillum perlucidum TaxID=1982602 RepID=UPI0013900414|nr:MliC family protein [Marinospirillum perlucidum]
MTCRNWIKGLILLQPVLGLTGCSFLTPQLNDATQAHLWQCEDQELMETRQVDSYLWLQLPASDSWLQLGRSRAASGQLFRNAEQQTSFWTQGERARVETPEKTWMQCQLKESGQAGELDKPDSLPGNASPEAITLRARGAYPGWSLEVRQAGSGQLTFNYGTEKHQLTNIEQTHQDLITRRYQAQTPENETVTYQVDNRICIDVNSGEPFQHRVEISFQGQTYKGCGQSY